jgi:hypothetical protein
MRLDFGMGQADVGPGNGNPQVVAVPRSAHQHHHPAFGEHGHLGHRGRHAGAGVKVLLHIGDREKPNLNADAGRIVGAFDVIDFIG